MAQKIREKGDIIKFIQEIDGKAVAEGVGIDRLFRNSIAPCQTFQLAVNPARRDGTALAVPKNKARAPSLRLKPGQGFPAEAFGKIHTPQLAALRA